MDFLKRLAGALSGPAPALQRRVYRLRVECARCGETIEAVVDLRNDLSVDEAEPGGSSGFICRKVVMGSARCFQPVEVVLRFDSARRLIDHETVGGKFLPAEAG